MLGGIVPTPGTCEYGKGEKVAGGIKGANQLTLRWEDNHGLLVWARCNHKGPYKWKREAEEELKR